MRHLVNCLTAARIVLAVCLLRTEAGSPAFFTLYTAAGLTDLLDGPLARRTGSQSAFGARLDSAADLVFFAAASACLLPRLWRLLPPAVWLGTLVTAAGRGTAFSLCLRHHGCIPALHTRLNKLTGAGLFCLPYVAGGHLAAYASALCLLALAAAAEDLWLVCRGECQVEAVGCFSWRNV